MKAGFSFQLLIVLYCIFFLYIRRKAAIQEIHFKQGFKKNIKKTAEETVFLQLMFLKSFCLGAAVNSREKFT